MINLPTPKNSGTPTLLPTKPHNQFPLIHIPNDQGWKPQFRTSVSKSLFENNSGICLWWRHISGETRCITFNYPSFFPVFFFFFQCFGFIPRFKVSANSVEHPIQPDVAGLSHLLQGLWIWGCPKGTTQQVHLGLFLPVQGRTFLTLDD